MAVAADDGIAVLSLTGANLISRAVPSGPATEGSISLDGTLASVNNIGELSTEIWDLSGPVPQNLTPPELDGFPVAWFYHDDAMLTVDPDIGAVRILDERFRPTDRVFDLIDLEGEQVTTNLAYLSPDRSMVAAAECCGIAAVMSVFDAETGEEITRLTDLVAYEPDTETRGRLIRSFDFSPDSTRLVAATDSGAAVVWDTQTWDVVTELSAGRLAVQATYSDDGRWLATVGSDGNIQLRDPVTGDPTGPPMVGNTDADSAQSQGPYWSPDGRSLISISDGFGRIWDIETRTQVGSSFPNDRSKDPIVSLNGRWLGTFTEGRFVVWDLDIDSWPELACQAAGRNLTAEEWNQFGPNDSDYRPTCPQWPAGPGVES